jgi:hypothetical protein
MPDSAIDLTAGLIPKEQIRQADSPYIDSEIDISDGLIPKEQADQPSFDDEIDLSAGLIPKEQIGQGEPPYADSGIDISAGLIPKEQADQPSFDDEIDLSAGLIPKELGDEQTTPYAPAPPSVQRGSSSSQLGDSLKPSAEFMQWRDQNYRRTNAGRWEGPDARVYTDQDLHTMYAIRQQKWSRPQAQSAQSSGKTVTLTYPDGTTEWRTGNHPQRDNNPGNIAAGNFTKEHGAIGKDHGFAVFPSAEAGWAAMDTNLRANYWDMNVDDAVAKWAPHKNGKGQVINDTAKYQATVRTALGVKGDTKLSSLTPQQFETLKQTIAQVEGFNDQTPGKKAKVIVQLPKRPDVIPRQ